jgi:hypothetical protein
VASLESRSHDVNVTSAVEGVVTATISHLNELLLDGLVLEFHGVDEVGGTELLGPLLLAVVDIDDNDLGWTVLDASLDDRKTDTAGTEDSNVGTLLDTTLAGSDDSGTVTSGNTTAEQASAVHGGLVGDLDDRNVGNDSVLGEGRGTHEVEKILALALEARGSVRHDTLALSGSNLATEVGLARLAELALLTLGGAGIECQLLSLATHRVSSDLLESNNVVASLHVGDALADRLDNTGTLVSKDNGESTLGVLAGESVCVCVADTGVIDLDSDLASLGSGNLDVLNGQVLASLPGDGSLASNGLSNGIGRHCGVRVFGCLRDELRVRREKLGGKDTGDWWCRFIMYAG